MEQLAEAAQIIMADPSTVSHQQRQEVEKVFMQFRLTKNPFSMCCNILENSSIPYLLFEAANLLRSGIVREWKELDLETKRHLQSYIMMYLVERPNIEHFLRETLVQTLAIMHKRGFTENKSEEKDDMLSQVEQLFKAPSNNLPLLGCSIFSAILQEHAITEKSYDVGLTWDQHFAAKRQFEVSHLQRIFLFVVDLLKSAVESLQSPNGGPPTIAKGNEWHLLRKLVLIAESTFSWPFISFQLPRRLVSVFLSDQTPSLKPPMDWTPVFQNDNLLPLFFKLYWTVRSDWDLGHHALSCLVQLSTLNGMVFSKNNIRDKYLARYLECLFSLLSSGEVHEQEALGISNIFKKLQQHFAPHVYSLLPTQLVVSFIDHLGRLTALFAERSAMEEHLDHEDQLYMEAFELLLRTWCVVVSTSSGSIPVGSFTFSSAGMLMADRIAMGRNPTMGNGFEQHSEKVKQCSIAIFDAYLKCHLSPPDGVRKQLDTEEISDSVEPDRILYKDQLLMIGTCGQQHLHHSVPLLCELLENRVGMLRQFLANNREAKDKFPEAVNNLYEDLHWLLLITSFVVTSTGGLPVPSDVQNYMKKNDCNVTDTLTLLASPQSMPEDFKLESAREDKKIDPVIRILSAVFRLAHMEEQALNANLTHLLSPELSCSIMWFMNRFAACYLMPEEISEQPGLPPIEQATVLNQAFGVGSEGAAWTLNFLLSIIERTLQTRCGEAALVNETITLFITLVDSKEIAQQVVKSEKLLAIVRLHVTGQLALVSSKASRGLMRGLSILGGCNAIDLETKEELWQHVLDPLITNFKNILDSPDFVKNYIAENYRKQVLHHIDNFIGAIQGSLMSSSKAIFNRIYPCLAAMIKLLDLYHNYADIVEALLELYLECGKRILCYLSPASSKQLYETAVELIKMYTKHNIGRRAVQSEGEQDQWRDLQLLMELLTSLLSKDFIDLCPITSGADENDKVAAADVCLFGLNLIMPLISRELLQIPPVCNQYYKMIVFIIEIYPQKICELNAELLKNLVVSVELGLTAFTPEVTTLCFDFIMVMTTYIFKHLAEESPVRQMMRPFLQKVMDLILSEQINSDVLQGQGASAFFILVCCYQNDYHVLVNQLISNQADPTVSQKLAENFTALTERVNFVSNSQNRLKFKSNFETFMSNVRGFLFVK